MDIGGVSWALIAEIGTEEAFAAIAQLRWQTAVVASLTLAVIIAIALLVTRVIVKPVKTVVDNLDILAKGEGDLTVRLDVANKDEIGQLAERFNAFLAKLQLMTKDIATGVATLSSSSTELSSIAQQMTEGAGQTAGKANAVAESARTMNEGMNTASNAMGESTQNADQVALAAEQVMSVEPRTSALMTKRHICHFCESVRKC